MGLTRKDESIVVRLSSGIEQAKENKNTIFDYINNIKNKCENREITYSEYEKLLNKKRDGKTLKQWLDVYDSYIKECSSKIEEKKRKSRNKKVLAVFLSVFLISLFLVSLFYFRTNIIGLVVQEQTKEFIEPSNLTFSSSETYEWKIQNPGELSSVKLSGYIEGEGEVKVYLDDYLILDSSNIKAKQAGLTGLAVDEASSETPESPSNPTDLSESSSTESTPAEASQEASASTPSETPQESPSYSEEQGAPKEQIQESTPSQPQEEPPSSSEQSEEPAASDIQLETNITETLTVTPEENITEITSENITQPTLPPKEKEEKPKEKQIRKFNKICEETCDLSSLSLNKSSYTLRIEINNASVSIEEIIYEILKEELAVNETIIELNESVINLTELNVTYINTTFSRIVLGQPVQWTKKVELDKPGRIKVELPKEAENIEVNKKADLPYSESIVSEQNESNISSGQNESNISSEQSEAAISSEQNEPAAFSITSSITGQAIEENQNKGFLSRIFSSLTGRAVTTEESIETMDVIIEDNASSYEITYETPAPQATEINLSENQKQIVISGPDLGYENVLAYTVLPKEVPMNQLALYHENENGKRVNVRAYDTNRNGLVDYIEWNVPHLSNQSYLLIINIIQAEHLDESRNFISDIYPEVKAIDGIWSETINNEEYVRLTFESNLTKSNDIKIYARGSENSKIEVYAKDSDELITSFENISAENWYRVYLNNLGSESYNSFDLKILGSVEIDYVVDPALNLEIIGNINDFSASVVLKTNPESTSAFDAYDMQSTPPPSYYSEFYSNISSASCGGTTCKLVVDSWNASENPRTLYLVYYIDSAQTGSLNFSWASLDGSEYYMNFTYYGTDSTYSTPVATRDMRTNTGYNASIAAASYLFVKIGYSVDNLTPNIVIKSPTNITYSISWLNFNISSTENLSLCRFTLNNWATNYTMTRFNDTYFNYTNTSIADGSYLAKFWCNDTANNTNNTETKAFTIDTTKPTINIVSPSNITYASTTIEFNVSTSENTSWCGFSLDGSANITMTRKNDTYFNYTNSTMTQGAHSIVFACNDTLGNMNSSSGTRSFTVDTLAPGVTITRPENTTYNTSSIPFNFTLSENSTCVYTLNNGATNYTMTINSSGTGANATHTGLADGSYRVYAYCNDTVGNKNYTTYKDFESNALPPKVTIISPQNATYNSTFVEFNVSTNENTSYCVFSLDNFATNYTLTKFNDTYFNLTNTSIAKASYTAKFWCNDTANNINNTEEVNFSVNENPPPFPPDTNINSTDGSNKTLQDLWCRATISSPEEKDLNASVEWYKENVFQFRFDYNNSYSSGTHFNASLHNGNTTKGDNWTCGIRTYDGSSYSTWVNSSNLRILNTEPQIITVYNQSMAVTINEGPASSWAKINFTAYDPDSAADLDDASSYANLSFPGEALRNTSVCQKTQSSGDYANYSCNITMWWWDTNGTWTANVQIKDLSGASATNSTVQDVGEQWSIINGSSLLITWPGLMPGSENQTASNSLIIYNNGNINFTNLSMNSTNLRGETDDTKYLWAENFSVGIETGPSKPECAGTSMNHGVFTKVESSILTRGNYTKNDGTAQEELYFCLRIVGRDLTVTQAYSTVKEGTWQINIFESLAVFAIVRRRKKRKVKERNNTYEFILRKRIEEKVPISIFTNKLGGLEAVVKYLKENLQLTYHEISQLTNRNERTIWASYNKAREKMPEKLEIRKATLTVPLSVFSTELTALEAVISYLKEKEFRNKEIAELLNRDERNIWTIYNKISKKAKKIKAKEEIKPEISIKEIKDKLSIPISIFTNKLGGLEAVVKYLKENLQLTYHEISQLTNRNERTIWASYNKAREKMPEKLEIRKATLTVPLSVFSTELTALEAVITYLKEKQMRYVEMASLLNRDERNIWTIYNRTVNP